MAGVDAAVRRACLALPEVSERLSHGAPTFFIRGRTSFVSLLMAGHHDLEFPHLACAAPAGVQRELVETRATAFFVPAYVGGRGWIGVRLDRDVSPAELADLCEGAYRTVAPRTLVRRLDEAGGPPGARE